MEEKRALVVEDDPDGRAALRELLREWGYAVEEAADGAGALALVRTQRPDVPMPFRMWLYPIPSLLALLGWLFMFVTSGQMVLLAGAGVIVLGVLVFIVRQRVAPLPSPVAIGDEV